MNFKSLFYKLSCIILVHISLFCISVLTCSKENITAKNKLCDINIINNQNQKIELNIEIANTEETQTRGLMFRDKLDKSSGMLFVFNKEEIRNFWMKNTYIPLSIAYISKDGIINEIHYMRPLDTSVTYPSIQPAMYALEVNQGWFRDNNISEGSKVVINGCLGK